MPLDNLIVDATRELMNIEKRVYPWMLAYWSELSLSERTARRYMARLAKEGRLIRLGPRYGYTVH